MGQIFDIIVVGGGHARTEAAAVAARMGASVALVSFDRHTIGAMSCNPAIGGLGKGHLVREVDAFDGLIARAADDSAIHYRMLNASKGAAVRGPRIQADRKRFGAAVRTIVANQANLTVIAAEAAALHEGAGGDVSGYAGFAHDLGGGAERLTGLAQGEGLLQGRQHPHRAGRTVGQQDHVLGQAEQPAGPLRGGQLAGTEPVSPQLRHLGGVDRVARGS